MKPPLSGLAVALAALLLSAQAHAQNARLACQGIIGDAPAALSGVRQYAPYNALGDGYVRFVGKVSAAGISGRIAYEGYTRTAPFSGVIVIPGRQFRVAVLDNTGGQMIVYDGTPTLGPPREIGRFRCIWQ